MIRPIVFMDTRFLTATFITRHMKQMDNGILKLRDFDEDGEIEDTHILSDWQSARAFLKRFKATAQPMLKDEPVVLGKAWIESLPGPSGTPWEMHEDDYAQAHIRTRTALIVTPDCYSMSGPDKVQLGVGMVNVIEHRVMHSEVNFSTWSRVHLIVDIRRPEDAEG
jgi:hypothetical protein